MVRDFYKTVCNMLFEDDQLLFSFLIAYKDQECEYTTDIRQVEFFIKGPLTNDGDINAEAGDEDASPDNTSKSLLQ